MLKHLLIVLALWIGTKGMSLKSDTILAGPVHSESPQRNCTSQGPECKVAVISMNGHNNYYAGQQIFYMHGLDYGKEGHKLCDGKCCKGKCCNDVSSDKVIREDYTIVPGIGAYKLHTSELTWNKARRACIEEGGHLTVIKSDAEERALLKMLRKQSVRTMWLGAHDLFEEGDWVTLDDEPLQTSRYTLWSTKYPNLPDNYGGNQHCAVLLIEGGLDDVDCNTSAAFGCKISLN